MIAIRILEQCPGQGAAYEQFKSLWKRCVKQESMDDDACQQARNASLALVKLYCWNPDQPQPGTSERCKELDNYLMKIMSSCPPTGPMPPPDSGKCEESLSASSSGSAAGA